MARFDRLAHVYDWFPLPNHTDLLRGRLEGRGGPRLDLGGGTGKYTVDIHQDAGSVVVLDASHGMLERAQRAGRRLSLVQGVGEAMPFPDDAFAAVTVTEAFHHFTPHQAAIVDELARVLDPDGVFLVEEIDPDRFLGRMVELGELLVFRFGSRFRPPDDLRALFEPRFDEVQVERTGSFTYLLEARGPRPTAGART